MWAWQVSGKEELARAANAAPGPDFALLFPLVLRCAEKGEETAQHLLREAGRELAHLAAKVIGQLWTRPEFVQLSLVGGVLLSSEVVRTAFSEEIRKFHEQCDIRISQAEPAMGALSLAQKLAVNPGAWNLYQ